VAAPSQISKFGGLGHMFPLPPPKYDPEIDDF